MIHHGDCLEVMAGMEPESVDAVVTDPPYGLEFMGKSWDKLDGAVPPGYVETPRMVEHRGLGGYRQRPNFFIAGARAQAFHARWAEAAYRVAKPSAYLLAFGGTRTVHRMTVALEDAGWIIRDMLVWAYASGFPKSKASLKPAWEPIVMARKPGPLRMLAIDECRIGAEQGGWNGRPRSEGSTRADMLSRSIGAPPVTHDHEWWAGSQGQFDPPQCLVCGTAKGTAGRWPANVILTDPIFDGGVDGVVGGGVTASGDPAGSMRNDPGWFGWGSEPVPLSGYGDSGTYSRFFLIPKADRGDREPVLPSLERREARTLPSGYAKERGDGWAPPLLRANVHPTVKPTELMRHLVRLVNPSGGTVLDPFLGSGSTGLACELEGFPWIGIEKEAEYVAIAEARLNGTQRGFGLAG